MTQLTFVNLDKEKLHIFVNHLRHYLCYVALWVDNRYHVRGILLCIILSKKILVYPGKLHNKNVTENVLLVKMLLPRQ